MTDSATGSAAGTGVRRGRRRVLDGRPDDGRVSSTAGAGAGGGLHDDPQDDVGPAGRLDRVIDAAFDPLRGRPEVDRAAAVLSNLADYGFVWVALALLKARRRGPRRRRAVVALAAAGFSSLLVNRAVKAAVSRERPEDHLRVAVRAPSSSSFPSGHTLAAFCTAFVLAETDTQTVVNVGFAGAVAASRVHLRAHHPSDVVGGAAIGTVLGLGLRPIVNLVAPAGAGRGGRRPDARRARRSARRASRREVRRRPTL